eukprot:s9_g28.t1
MAKPKTKKNTSAWLVAARKGGTTRQDVRLLFNIRDGTPDEAYVAAAQVDTKWKVKGQTALYYAAARQDSYAEGLSRFLMSRSRNKPVTKRDDWGQSPLFYAAREGHTELCRFFVEKCGMSVHQVDKWGDTPIFYAVEFQKLETIVWLLKKGASLAVVNKEMQSPTSIASLEVTRELQARVEEWGEPREPLKARSPEPESPKAQKRKRGKRAEEEEISAAEGFRAMEEWAQRPPKFRKSSTSQNRRHCKEAEVLAETTEFRPEYSIELPTADALEEIRQLEKTAVVEQAELFKAQLFFRSCRAADFCSVLGACEKDCQFFREYSDAVANRGKSGSLVLVARAKRTDRIVAFLRADLSDQELVIRRLKVHLDHGGQGLDKLLIQCAEAQALSTGWDFRSVTLRVPSVHSRAQKKFLRLGFDITEEPAAGPSTSTLSMRLKMVRRANHVPAPPSESERFPPVKPYVQTAVAQWHLKPGEEPTARALNTAEEWDDDDSATHSSMPPLIPVTPYWLDESRD